MKFVDAQRVGAHARDTSDARYAGHDILRTKSADNSIRAAVRVEHHTVSRGEPRDINRVVGGAAFDVNCAVSEACSGEVAHNDNCVARRRPAVDDTVAVVCGSQQGVDGDLLDIVELCDDRRRYPYRGTGDYDFGVGGKTRDACGDRRSPRHDREGFGAGRPVQGVRICASTTINEIGAAVGRALGNGVIAQSAVDEVTTATTDKGVVSSAAVEDVAIAAAVERVVAPQAENGLRTSASVNRSAVIGDVAGVTDDPVGRAVDSQVLDVGQRVNASSGVGGDREASRDAHARGRESVVGHRPRIGGSIDTGATIERVATGSAGENVVARVAVEDIVASLAGKSVVTSAAIERVDARTPVERIIATETGESVGANTARYDVIEPVAAAVESSSPCVNKVLNGGAERIGRKAGANGVCTLPRKLSDCHDARTNGASSNDVSIVAYPPS